MTGTRSDPVLFPDLDGGGLVVLGQLPGCRSGLGGPLPTATPEESSRVLLPSGILATPRTWRWTNERQVALPGRSWSLVEEEEARSLV